MKNARHRKLKSAPRRFTRSCPPALASAILLAAGLSQDARAGIQTLTSFEVPAQGATSFTAAGGEIGWTRTTSLNNPHSTEGVRITSGLSGEFASLLTAPGGSNAYLSRSATSGGMAEVLTFDSVAVTAGQQIRLRYGVSTTSWEATDQSVFTYSINGGSPVSLLSLIGTAQIDGAEGSWKTVTSAALPTGNLVLSWSTRTDSSAAAEGVLMDLYQLITPGKTLTWNNHPSGTWDNGVSGNTVWLNTTPAADFFSDGDDAVFSQNPSPTTVTIAAGGVAPNTTAISNTAGTYNFAGAAITGAGALAKSNAGAVVFSNTGNNFGAATVSGGSATFDNATTFASLAASGGSSVVLKAANTNAGGTTISGGASVEVQASGGLGAGALSINGATLKGSTAAAISLANNWSIDATNGGLIDVAAGTVMTMSGTLTTTGTNFPTQTLTKTGNGILALTNNFGGAYRSQNLNVQGGVLRLQHAGNVLANEPIVAISAGAYLDESWDDGETMGGITGGGTFVGRNGGTAGGGITLNVASNFSGKITAGTNGIVNGSAVELGATDFTQAGADSRRVDFHVASAVTVSLSGSNSDFAGRVFVDSGTLNFSNVVNRGVTGASALGLGNVATTPVTAGTDISLGSGGSAANLNYTGTTANSTDRTITLAGTGALTLGVTDAAGKLTLTGVINSSATPASFTKKGLGTLVLANGNTYAGNTTVSEGKLLANNTSGSATSGGNVVVDATGTLGGTGTITGSVTVNGILSPGASIESLATGAVSFANGSTLAFETSYGDSSKADLLDITGDLALNGTVNLDLSGADLANASWGLVKLSIASYTGSLLGGGTFNGWADGSSHTFGGNQWIIDYNDTTAGINFTSEQSGQFVTLTNLIPEPTSFAFLGLGSLALLRRRRERA